MIPHTMVTTSFELDGYEVKRTLGIVRGIIVRSRSVLGTIGASLCYGTAVLVEQKH